MDNVKTYKDLQVGDTCVITNEFHKYWSKVAEITKERITTDDGHSFMISTGKMIGCPEWNMNYIHYADENMIDEIIKEKGCEIILEIINKTHFESYSYNELKEICKIIDNHDRREKVNHENISLIKNTSYDHFSYDELETICNVIRNHIEK